MKEFLSLLIFLIIFQGSGYSQEIILPELDGFKKELNYPVYTPDDLWDYINGGAESYNALGFSDLHIAEYTKGKKITVKLEIYHHIDETMAFGIYSLERAPSYDFYKIGVQGYREEGMINFLKGPYYVKITTSSKSKKALHTVDLLGDKVSASLEGSETFPPSLSLFPSEGFKENEEMYIAEDVLGHEFLQMAFRGSYDVDDNSFYVYLFTGGKEGSYYEMVNSYLDKNDMETGDANAGKFSFMDGYNGVIYLAWRNDLLVVISGLNENESGIADRYINKILE